MPHTQGFTGILPHGVYAGARPRLILLVIAFLSTIVITSPGTAGSPASENSRLNEHDNSSVSDTSYLLRVFSLHGSITITPNLPTYPPGTTVQISATPDSAFLFNYWSGNGFYLYSTENPLTIVMNSNKNITANYKSTQYTLTTISNGHTVTKNPNTPLYSPGTAVEIQAIPNEQYLFSNWSGDIPPGTEQTNPLTIIMDTNKIVAANFIYDSNLTILTLTASYGTILSDPFAPYYHVGTSVTITAVPQTGYLFDYWSGSVSPGETAINPLTVVMDNDKSIQAHFLFNPTNRFLTVASGYGSVTLNPNRPWYDNGTLVALTATPLPGYLFDSWSGTITPEFIHDNPLTLVMDTDRAITANYILDPDNKFLTLNAVHGSIVPNPDRPWYPESSTVILTAVPDPQYYFRSWTGNITPPGDSMINPATILMNQHQTVTANFSRALRISGRMFHDYNKNGILDEQEPGIPNNEVRLTGKTTKQTLTDPLGNFYFRNLELGQYTVSHSAYYPWISTSPSTSVSITLVENEDYDSIVFGKYYAYNSVSGTVFYDVNENGIKETSDPGVQGWIVRSINASGEQTDTTDVNGKYIFNEINPGVCSVYVVPAESWEKITPRSVSGYSLYFSGYDAHYTTLNFAVHPIPIRLKLPMVYFDENHNSVQTIYWGVRPGATRGIWRADPTANTIDFSEGEDELPPSFTDGFDVRFIKVNNTKWVYGNGSWTDIHPYTSQSQTDTFRLSFYTGPRSGGSYPVTFTWSPSLVSESFSGNVLLQRSNINVANMKTTDHFIIDNNETSNLLLIAKGPVLASIPSLFSLGWNIISVPFDGLDTITTLFPSAASAAFSYDQTTGYRKQNSVEPGRGYWLKLSNSVFESPLSGSQRLQDTIDVVPGWNLIGALSDTIPVSSITSIPVGIFNGQMFRYKRGYMIPQYLEPFLGYWLYATQEGKIILNANGLEKRPVEASLQDTEPETAEFSFTDDVENHQSLFISTAHSTSSKNVLPPLPPAGIFDIRFSTDTWKEFTGGKRTELPLRLTSVAYPLTISWSNVAPGTTSLRLPGQTIPLGENGSLALEQAPEYAVMVIEAASPVAEPEQFALEQNYPNPFNPSTAVSYQTPIPGYISLKIFTVLGEEIATLVEKEQEAGYHRIEWNGSDSPSGIYFCRLTVTGANGMIIYSNTKKMLYIK